MDDKFIEKYYETVILPLYGDAVTFSKITWKDHGRVGLDAWGHYFDDQNGREYVLIYEDFPGSEYLNDDLTHEVVRCGDEISVQITTTPKSTVDNITGYFTLYAEKQ
ncbi:MAG TPA: hypothetical protein PLZ58_03660 [Candidatus Saccharibacteria bacterium]|nr:hypothetical protein [Candidatus Saccharibacteria bacterium]HRQ06829.1 hypothetical protein [Candidatus Saccharibacteria bacterium]